MKLMFLRPLSPAAKVRSESVWISVQVERQFSPTSVPPKISLASTTSTPTVPTKAGAIKSFAAFKAAMSRLTDVPAILVLITPVVADVPVSTPLKLPSTRRSARMCALP